MATIDEIVGFDENQGANPQMLVVPTTSSIKCDSCHMSIILSEIPFENKGQPPWHLNDWETKKAQAYTFEMLKSISTCEMPMGIRDASSEGYSSELGSKVKQGSSGLSDGKVVESGHTFTSHEDRRMMMNIHEAAYCCR